MDMDAHKVKDIIGDNPRFISPFEEPYGYYIWSGENENISRTYIEKYWEKLEYMSENIDILIQQAFRLDFYDFCGADQNVIASPDEMCRRLIVESFVLDIKDYSVGCCLSNSQFMFGHFIDCLWDDSWNLVYSYIC